MLFPGFAFHFWSHFLFPCHPFRVVLCMHFVHVLHQDCPFLWNGKEKEYLALVSMPSWAILYWIKMLGGRYDQKVYYICRAQFTECNNICQSMSFNLLHILNTNHYRMTLHFQWMRTTTALSCKNAITDPEQMRSLIRSIAWAVCMFPGNFVITSLRWQFSEL